ncbi:MAG: TATA box-binding protein, partial [Candidatus Geothermarchaeota archaeon]
DLHGKINLEQAALKLEGTMYEPEEFPGLIYRMMEPKVVILMFASGKLVCTGAKTEREVYEAVYKLKKILEENQLITYATSR